MLIRLWTFGFFLKKILGVGLGVLRGNLILGRKLCVRRNFNYGYGCRKKIAGFLKNFEVLLR